MRKSLFLGFKLFLCSLLLLLVIIAWVRLWSSESVNVDSSEYVSLNTGESLSSFSEKLYKKNIIDNKFFFHIYVKFFAEYRLFQAGKYKFTSKVSPSYIVSKVSSGSVYKDIVLKYTIPEGFNIHQIIYRLSSFGIDDEELNRLAFDKKFLASLNIKQPSIEGYIYPATYIFYDEVPSPATILSHMVKNFFRKIPNDYYDSIKSRKISFTDAVVIASLIEKETSVREEKFMIAEVILNRLKGGYHLGIDASVIYGIKNFDGDLKTSDLKDTSNLYNTRVHRGLPPTAICSFSLGALLSVLSPSNNGYYYYVARPGDKNKRHHFSKTLKEHRKYVKKLVNFSK